jgi:hypothetical protein
MTYFTGRQPNSVAVGDFNNDYRLDIIVVNFDGSTVGLFIEYGDGSFSNQITYSTGSYSRPYSVAVADFEGVPLKKRQISSKKTKFEINT